MGELLKEAGEEAEMVLENGLTSSLAKKKDGQFDDGNECEYAHCSVLMRRR